MDRVRVVLNLAPLGPRPVVPDGEIAENLPFALNIGASVTRSDGSDIPRLGPDASAWRQHLLPWNLVAPNQAPLTAWWPGSGTAATTIAARPPASQPGLGLEHLKTTFREAYAPSNPDTLPAHLQTQVAALHWTPPDNGQSIDLLETGEPVPRLVDLVFHLSRLPGGVGAHLGAALHFNINVPEFAGNPNDRRLIAAPQVSLPLPGEAEAVPWDPQDVSAITSTGPGGSLIWPYSPVGHPQPTELAVEVVLRPYSVPLEADTGADQPVVMDRNTFWVPGSEIKPGARGPHGRAQHELGNALDSVATIAALKHDYLKKRAALGQENDPLAEDSIAEEKTVITILDMLAASAALERMSPLLPPMGTETGLERQRLTAIAGARRSVRDSVGNPDAIARIEAEYAADPFGLLTVLIETVEAAGGPAARPEQPTPWGAIAGHVSGLASQELANLHSDFWRRLHRKSENATMPVFQPDPSDFMAGPVARAVFERRARLRAVLWAETALEIDVATAATIDIGTGIMDSLSALFPDATAPAWGSVRTRLKSEDRGTLTVGQVDDRIDRAVSAVRALFRNEAGDDWAEGFADLVKAHAAFQSAGDVTAPPSDRGLVFTYGKPINITMDPDGTAPTDKRGATSLIESISGLALLVRRDDGSERPWTLVSIGELMGPETEENNWQRAPLLAPGTLLPVPQELAMLEQTAFPEMSYDGSHKGAQTQESPFSVGAPDDGEQQPFDTVDLTRYRARIPADHLGALAPVLRYGDRYQVALPGIGEAGGMNVELSGVGPDTAGDPTKLLETALKQGFEVPEVAQSPEMDFLCPTPIGEITVVAPTTSDGTDSRLRDQGGQLIPLGELRDAENGWPKIPEGVRLFIDDIDAAAVPGATGPSTEERAATVLLAQTGTVRPDAGVPGEIGFAIAPPVCPFEELKRWLAPRHDDADRPEKIARIKAAMAHRMRLDRRRFEAGAGMGVPDPAFLHPAVRRLYVSLTVFDRAPGTRAFKTVIRLPIDIAAGAHETAVPIPVRIVAVADGAPEMVETQGGRVEISLPPATAALLRIAPAVTDEDMSRFTPSASASAAEIEQGWSAFPPSIVALETPILPDNLAELATSVHGALGLDRIGQEVILRLDRTKLDPWTDSIGGYEILRRNWFWRGAPLSVPVSDTPFGTEPDWLTDQDGMPHRAVYPLPDLEDLEPPEISTDGLDAWKRLVAPPDAYRVDRLDRKPWLVTELGPPQTDTEKLRPALHTDTRQRLGNAGYGGYRLRLHSRYAPILPRSQGTFEATEPSGLPEWQDIFMPYEGPAPRPPAPLAVMPLLSGVDAGPVGPAAEKGHDPASPVLVMFDHTPYRDLGLTEYLTAHLVPDVVDGERPPPDPAGDGEDLTTDEESFDIPYRTGPAPHAVRSWPKTKGYWGTPADADSELRVWGPFGLTFDVTDTEPGIFGCVYVVYPPERHRAHWFADVRFERGVKTLEVDQTDEDPSWVWEPDPERSTRSNAPRQIYFFPQSRIFRDGADTLPLLGAFEPGDGAGGRFGLSVANDAIPANLEKVFSSQTHRLVVLVSVIVTDSLTRQPVPLPFALFSLRNPGTGVEAVPFGSDRIPESAVLEDADLVATIWTIRTDTKRRVGEWVWDNPQGHGMRDFFRSILGSKVGVERASWNARDFLDLDDVAGVIEGHHGPFRLKIVGD